MAKRRRGMNKSEWRKRRLEKAREENVCYLKVCDKPLDPPTPQERWVDRDEERRWRKAFCRGCFREYLERRESGITPPSPRKAERCFCGRAAKAYLADAYCVGCYKAEIGFEAMKDARGERGIRDANELNRIADAAMKEAGRETVRLRKLHAENPAMAVAEGIALVAGVRARSHERAKAIRDAWVDESA